MKLDLVMCKFVTFYCGCGTMFTCCVDTVGKYVGLMVIGAKHKIKFKPKFSIKVIHPLKITKLTQSLL